VTGRRGTEHQPLRVKGDPETAHIRQHVSGIGEERQ